MAFVVPFAETAGDVPRVTKLVADREVGVAESLAAAMPKASSGAPIAP
jgi:hypothetical protein